MKLNDLKQAAAVARQDHEIAEGKAAELQVSAKADKAKAEQARLEYKRVRKAAKQAKKLALAAEEQARKCCRAWEKAQKGLAKALKKLAKAKGEGKKKPALAAPVPGPDAAPKPVAEKQAASTSKTRKPAADSQ